MPKRGSEKGITLLELTLSLALAMVLISAFFVAYRGMMQAINLVANEVNGTSRVAEMLDAIALDLDRSENAPVVAPGGLSVTFTLGGQAITYRVVSASPGTPQASQDVYIERQQGSAGPWTSVGPRRVIANWHPFPGTLTAYDNSNVVGFNYVPFFVLDSGVAGVGGRSAHVVLHAVVQGTQDASARYVRTRSASRLLP